MIRTYAAAGVLVHDPATGLTHHSPTPLPPSRIQLDQREVRSWPAAVLASLDLSQPVSVCWSPIVRCNLHCPQCLDDITVPEGDGTTRARIAGLLAASDVLGVDISGGEPLLLRDLSDLVDAVHASGRIAVSVTTNGWHLQRRAGDLAGVVDAIRVSLDGPDPDSHDRIRGADSFRRATLGIRAATDVGIPVQIQTVLMAGTAHGAQRTVDRAVELGACGLTFLQMLPIGAGRSLPTQMLTDIAAADLVARLRAPDNLVLRLRTRDAAAGFTVIRADGQVWRNDANALNITGLRPLHSVADLALTGRDGSP